MSAPPGKPERTRIGGGWRLHPVLGSSGKRKCYRYAEGCQGRIPVPAVIVSVVKRILKDLSCQTWPDESQNENKEISV